ncbi:MAG: ABC transporter permease [Planctomycetota bacterium]|nr:MAG: ABC transporter permease [Planctomycetota bacterium]
MNKKTERPPSSVSSPQRSEIRRFFRVFLRRGPVTLGVIAMLLFLITSAFGPLFSPYNPYAQDLGNVLSKPSLKHPLGTDSLGRDTLSRLIYGARITLAVGIIAVMIGAVVGSILGLIAGFFGGWINAIIMRLTDALMAVPPLLLALVLAALLGTGIKNVMLAIGFSLMPVFSRLVCGLTLSVRENDYVLAVRAAGAGSVRVMLLHVLPNCLSSLIVQITLTIGGAILIEASLSFLGLGISPPMAAWGSMVYDGYRYLTTYPVLSFAPGLAVMVVVLAFNMVGDGLRDSLDPRLRGII